MSPRPRKAAPLFTLIIALAWLLAASGGAVLAFPQDHGWLYDAIDRLKTLGIMPLWAGVVRPMPAAHLKAAVEEASKRAHGRSLSYRDFTLLQELRRVVDLAPAVGLDTGPTPFGITRPSVFVSGHRQSLEWIAGIGPEPLLNAGAVFFPMGHIEVLMGRSPVGWGPNRWGGLLFSETASGIDRIQLSIRRRSARFTKFIGWLDGGRSILGARLDIMYRPTIRISFAESILMLGGPYWPYVVHPMPILLNEYLEQQLRRDPGDNQFNSFDFEWLIRPGIRLFGELLIDDLTVPTPLANSPHRVGATMGGQWLLGNGSSFHAIYSAVTNWTYTTSEGTSLHYLLRGIPLGHPIGSDFDTLHVRWAPPRDPLAIFWVTYIRKGEGVIGRTWTSESEAREFVFLRGVVEHSLIAGTDFRFKANDWQGTFGPWFAYRTNAEHIQGVQRLDWGISLSMGRTY